MASSLVAISRATKRRVSSGWAWAQRPARCTTRSSASTRSGRCSASAASTVKVRGVPLLMRTRGSGWRPNSLTSCAPIRLATKRPSAPLTKIASTSPRTRASASRKYGWRRRSPNRLGVPCCWITDSSITKSTSCTSLCCKPTSDRPETRPLRAVARWKSIRSLTRWGTPKRLPARSSGLSMPRPGRVTRAWNSSVQVIATRRVSLPLARAQIGGILPPWRKDQGRRWSKWLSRTLRSLESKMDSTPIPSAAKACCSQPCCAAMPSGDGTGQRVYQSELGC